MRVWKRMIAAALLAAVVGVVAGCQDTGEQRPRPSGPTPTASSPSAPPQPQEAALARVSGRDLVDTSGQPFRIQSVSLGLEDVSAMPSQADYEDIAAMGFNTVTLHLTYRLLEEEQKPFRYLPQGWRTLDAHLQAAEQAGLLVILNMDTPQGGFQSWEEGDTLWTEQQNRQRLCALWEQIAKRYRKNATVLGYSLLNEPCPVGDSAAAALKAWQLLAQQMADAVRSQEDAHILFVEGVTRYSDGAGGYINLTNEERPDLGFPQLEDDNVVYQFQQYSPYAYTHQQDAGDLPYLKYPGTFVVDMPGGETSSWSTQDNQDYNISAGGWQTLRSGVIQAQDEGMRYVSPSISLWALGEGGRVWVDEMYVDELDETGALVGSPLHLDFDGPVNFSLYGESGECRYAQDGGADGQGGGLYIGGVVEYAQAVLEPARIPVTPGHSYQLRFTARGEGLEDSSVISPILTAHYGGPALVADRAYLEAEMQAYTAFAQTADRPLYVGGFGANRNCFVQGRGGAQWVADMLDILEERQFHFNYFIYRNDYFGVYTLDGQGNEVLKELFAARLGG